MRLMLEMMEMCREQELGVPQGNFSVFSLLSCSCCWTVELGPGAKPCVRRG